jgi:CO/xanthine dehydrogenase FAD-binding subunit
VEESLRGQVFGEGTLAGARVAWAETMHFRTSPRRSTAEYRHHLSGSLFEKVIRSAWERAGTALAVEE